MKYLKKFEVKEYTNYTSRIIYDKDNVILKEHISGELIFRINNKNISLTTGIFILLNTKYENDDDIRNIKIINKPNGPALNNNATRKSVLNLISKKYNWDLNTIKNKFYKLIRFNKMFEKSNTIGDLFDNARKLIIDQIAFHFDVQKYNL